MIILLQVSAKKLLATSCIIVSFVFAQEKVGINTTSPTHTLDVNGNMRIRDMKDVGSVAYITGATTDGEIQKFQVYKYIIDSGVAVNTQPVDIIVAKDEAVNSQPDLGISRTVTVPAGKRYFVAVMY